jgi:hypothetical protein
MQRLLGEVEVAEEADQGCKDAARVGAVDSLDRCTSAGGAGDVRGGYCAFISQIGRTSMLPQRVPGIFDATWIASLRSRASMR